jgi:Peptidase family M28/PDZ domain
LWVAPTEAEIRRYRELVTTLASEKMEGRGPGTKGIELARDYLIEQFEKAGLQPVFQPGAKQAEAPVQLSFLQPFDIRLGTKVKEAKLTSTGNGGAAREFQLDKDYTVMGFSAQATVQGEAVFVGYGVKHDPHKYDSYATNGQPAPHDALKGQVAICWRYEPMTAAGKSAWDEKGSWQSSLLHLKAALAASHGASALLYINPPTHEKEGLKSTAASAGIVAPIPVIQITPEAFKAILAQAGRPADDAALKQLQKDTDEGRTGPQTLAGVTLALTVSLEVQTVPVHNVAAVLPGAGTLADQVVVIGAHYDHLGFTGDTEKRINFGADDNASGTSGVVLLAERFGKLARQPQGLPEPRRALLFVAFTGEERGLLGSRYMVEHLDQQGLKTDQVTAMLNLDMIGRMRDERLMVGGVASGDRWNALVDAALQGAGVAAQRSPSGFGPSDHSSFYGAKIPVLFFLASLHSDIHSPRDTADKINCEGAVKIAHLVDAIARQLWVDPLRMAYVAPQPGQDVMGAAPRGVYLGIRPEPVGNDAPGVRIGDLLPEGPAAKAELKPGDVILKWGGADIATVTDLLNLLSKQKPEDKVKLTVRRGPQTLDINVTLGKQ